jgi:murein peptide amidase A
MTHFTVMNFIRKYPFLLFFLFISASIYAVKEITAEDLVLTQKTPQGRLIRCYKKGNNGKKILLIGSIHGNEKAGIILSIKVLNYLFEKPGSINTLICIPTVNPDGNSSDKRTNSNNIDINRNFPSSNWVYSDSSKLELKKKMFWGGNQPASEIETRFILKVDSLFHPDALIILHQFMDCVQYDGTGMDLAKFIAVRSKQKLLDNIGYTTEGSIGSYFGEDKRKEVVTIEIPENPSDTLQMNIVNAIVDAVTTGY